MVPNKEFRGSGPQSHFCLSHDIQIIFLNASCYLALSLSFAQKHRLEVPRVSGMDDVTALVIRFIPVKINA